MDRNYTRAVRLLEVDRGRMYGGRGARTRLAKRVRFVASVMGSMAFANVMASATQHARTITYHFYLMLQELD